MQIGRRQEFSMCGVERPRMHAHLLGTFTALATAWPTLTL
jgi:hypothetical protein